MNLNPFKNLIDKIFAMPEGILNLIKNKLVGASNIVAQGIDASSWLSPIAILGPQWIKVVNSLLAGAGIVFIFWLGRQVYNLYLSYKEGVQWW